MKVLIATDGSTWSHDAMVEASRLVPLKDAEVHVVAVASLAPLMTGYEAAAAMTTLVIEREEATATLNAAKAVGDLAALGISATPHERTGDPGDEIVALARELQADLVVIGSHGKNFFERLFMGSTSDAVAHRWHGAVLVVRPKA